MNMKKASAWILALLLIFLSSLPVFADTSPEASAQPPGLLSEKETLRITVPGAGGSASVNGKSAKLEAPAYISGKQLMVPVKFLASSLGAKYEYNAKTHTIKVTKGSASIAMQTGVKTASVNGKKVQLAAVPVSKKAVIFCPAEFMALNLGAGYTWDDKAKTATIKVVTTIITFPDPGLEAAVRKTLGGGSGDLELEAVAGITTLYASASGIKDLDGIQYLKSLKFVDLSDNHISDITPLKELSGLTGLNLEDNQLSDITPLNALTKLDNVRLWSQNSLDGINLLYKKAKEITDKVIKPEMTELEKELALYDYIITHSRYDKLNYDHGTIPTESHNAYGILVKGVGVCDGYSQALKILMNLAGLECYEVVGSKIGMEDEGHAWNIVRINGAYYHIDATYDDPVSESGTSILQHTYFNLSDRQISTDHTWDRSRYPECNTDSEFFYKETDYYKSAVFGEEASFSVIDDYIYRIGPDGSYEKICDDRASYINLSNGQIYYVNLDDGNKIYRIGPDGSGRMKFSDYEAEWLTVKDSWLYFICNHKIHRMDINSRFITSLNSEDAVSFYTINGDWIYYKAYIRNTGPRLFRMNLDGNNRTMLGTSVKPAGFELSPDGRSVSYSYSRMEFIEDGWLYFVNEADSDRLYKMKLDGSSPAKICDDKAEEYYIEIFNGRIYYKNSDDGKKYYRIGIDGTDRQPLE